MDHIERLEEAQIAFTLCDLIEQLKVLIRQRYEDEFQEINSQIIAEMDELLDKSFSS